MPKMHFCNADHSLRLKRTLKALLDAGENGITSAALSQRTGSVAVATDVSELRKNGYHIYCDYLYKTTAGRKVFCYQIESGR